MVKKIAVNSQIQKPNNRKSFHLEFLNASQKLAWMAFEQNSVLFMVGPAGSSKTHLSIAFAIGEVLSKRKKKIVLARPVVEAGEKLGFLPGTMEDKINPYLLPIFDCIERCVGENNIEREKVDKSLEISPLAYLRGRTFFNSICILDEAQNATKNQLKLFLTRLGDNSKLIINGDISQSDLRKEDQGGLWDIIKMLEPVRDIGIVEFKENSIVRHPLVAEILKVWKD